ncbi:hypothetical protein D9M68_903320 [compost metagenome]
MNNTVKCMRIGGNTMYHDQVRLVRPGIKLQVVLLKAVTFDEMILHQLIIYCKAILYSSPHGTTKNKIYRRWQNYRNFTNASDYLNGSVPFDLKEQKVFLN